MTKLTIEQILFWDQVFEQKIIDLELGTDPAHDVAHFKRVVATAKKLAIEENAKIEVILPAAWLHDYINIPKNDPRRSQASRLAASAAIEYLQSVNYPSEYFEEIRHAIEAHSFSANIEAKTIEAKIVQDCDRLDGLGAIGVARCFSVGALFKRSIYHLEDPFGLNHERDDYKYTIDHFYIKLFKVAKTLQTKAGQVEGQRRIQFMQEFLRQIGSEIGHKFPENI